MQKLLLNGSKTETKQRLSFQNKPWGFNKTHFLPFYLPNCTHGDDVRVRHQLNSISYQMQASEFADFPPPRLAFFQSTIQLAIVASSKGHWVAH